MKIGFASIQLLSPQLLEILQMYACIKYLNVCFQGWNILSAQLCQQSYLLCQWEMSAWESGKYPLAANGAF